MIWSSNGINNLYIDLSIPTSSVISMVLTWEWSWMGLCCVMVYSSIPQSFFFFFLIETHCPVLILIWKISIWKAEGISHIFLASDKHKFLISNSPFHRGNHLNWSNYKGFVDILVKSKIQTQSNLNSNRIIYLHPWRKLSTTSLPNSLGLFCRE